MQFDPPDAHIRLDLSGMPAVYTPRQLQQRADQMIDEIEDLLQLKDRLIHSRLRYRISVDVESGKIKHLLLLDLTPKESAQFDLFWGTLDHHALQKALTTDSHTLVDAFRTAPQLRDRAVVQLAMRNAAAVRNCAAQSVPAMDCDAHAYLKNRRRRFNGRVSGIPWQLELAHVGFEWDCTPTRMQARICRERDGFSLRPLKTQASAIRGNPRLKMELPADLDALAVLDHAAHTGVPQWILVRLARDPGDTEPSRADFLQFEKPDAEPN
ncbi:MAG: hypothetical protein JWN34_5922 [Bryobacterales bacterium]|nr:hypothetical protein [Bryobacterales bacterium]